MENLEQKLNNQEQKKDIHFVLSESYTIFLLAVILGVIFDLIFPLDLLQNQSSQYSGLFLILIGSFFIYWAQKTSFLVGKKMEKEKNHPGFHFGPYKYLRAPTHLGLFIMTLGLALIINSVFALFFVIVAHFLTKFVFVKKQEKMLEEKYGQSYSSYKRKTKNPI
jgi:protein-S-isoprenylcysteine O-methyltransferase Ste14